MQHYTQNIHILLSLHFDQGILLRGCHFIDRLAIRVTILCFLLLGLMGFGILGVGTSRGRGRGRRGTGTGGVLGTSFFS